LKTENEIEHIISVLLDKREKYPEKKHEIDFSILVLKSVLD